MVFFSFTKTYFFFDLEEVVDFLAADFVAVFFVEQEELQQDFEALEP